MQSPNPGGSRRVERRRRHRLAIVFPPPRRHQRCGHGDHGAQRPRSRLHGNTVAALGQRRGHERLPVGRTREHVVDGDDARQQRPNRIAGLVRRWRQRRRRGRRRRHGRRRRPRAWSARRSSSPRRRRADRRMMRPPSRRRATAAAARHGTDSPPRAHAAQTVPDHSTAKKAPRPVGSSRALASTAAAAHRDGARGPGRPRWPPTADHPRPPDRRFPSAAGTAPGCATATGSGN